MLEIAIYNGNNVYEPVIKDEVTLTTERKSYPGMLKFTCIYDSKLKIANGNMVTLKHDNKGIFKGYIFSIAESEDKTSYRITAYDQLRYFKNKDSFVYENKTTSWLVKKFCSDFGFQKGTIDDTKINISRSDVDKTLFDAFNSSNDDTLVASKNVFVLYDDYGKLNLRNIASMRVGLLVCDSTGSKYEYTSSIDEETYNRVKLYYDNDKTGKRELFIAQDSGNISKWGILQHYESVDNPKTAKNKANALLKLYNSEKKTLKFKEVFGDFKVRAGVMIVVNIILADREIVSYMLVEKCKHTFKNGTHLMDLTLVGGDFSE